MNVEPISRFLLVGLAILALTACGGGGGGGSSSLVSGEGSGTSANDSIDGSITLSISWAAEGGEDNDRILSNNEIATLTAEVTENGRPAEVVVLFETTIGTLLQSSAQTVDGRASVDMQGNGEAGAAAVTARATLSDGTEVTDSITVQTAGIQTEDNTVIIEPINVGSDGVLDGNEKTDIIVSVLEDGVAQDGISVTFEVTDGVGSLNPASATTSGGGQAVVQIIGGGEAGTIEITARATLNNGIAIQDVQTIQATAVRPSITLTIRDQSGTETTNFGANQVLTLEAVVTDYDGSTLDDDDAGVVVTFDASNLGTLTNSTNVTERNVCPVDLIQVDNDCAFVVLTSNATAAVAEVIVTATINGIAIEDRLVVTNTSVNSGSPDQDSFSITRSFNGEGFSLSDSVATEGDQFNGQEVLVRVDLADFASNPVPDGTLVNFRTEFGDIEEECLTVGGNCEVSFFTSEPRGPSNTEVTLKDLDNDNCPTDLIINELVTINEEDKGPTEYRVAEIISVYRQSTETFISEGVQYLSTANGIDCLACTPGQIMEITYRRLWLDEEDDDATSHVLATPGIATEPFMAVVGTPCAAPVRPKKEVIDGSIKPGASTSVTGVGTSFKLDLTVGDRLKLGQEVRTITQITSDTTLIVDSAFSDSGNDLSPERIAAPAYLGGMGQPYGGRSTVLAYTLGEESFVDVNGNDEYDVGETFEDLTEVFLDKNEDGVFGDVNADSATAGTFGPYRDNGLGSEAPGQAREKSAPSCYGPKTVLGFIGNGGESTEADEYCFQNGGEEEFFIDGGSENGLMDAGNGIYNGSRCLRPLQDADGIDQGEDGNFEDDTVCSTELVNISRQVQILLSGSVARTEFRALDADGEGGSFGLGEIVTGIVNRSGLAVSGNIANPTGWGAISTNNVTVTTLADSLPGAPFGGASIDTTGLDAGNGPADSDELVGLLEIPNPFPTTFATYEVSFNIVEWTAGSVEVFVGDDLIVPACAGSVVSATTICSASNISLAALDNLRFVVADTDAGVGVNARFVGTITNVAVSGVSTGVDADFQSDVDLVSNDRTATTLREFNVGDTLGATTVYPGASERFSPSGVLPALSTTLTDGIFLFTDRFNGRLPEGTTVAISSDNSLGCSLTSVGGNIVNFPVPGLVTGGPHEGTVTVGQDVTTATTFRVQVGGGGNGVITATVTTPLGGVTTDRIACNLLL